VWAFRVDESGVRFNAFDVAEFRKPIKEEAISTAYIQYLKIGACSQMPMQHF
jgi:hypothetical protein